MSYNSSLYLIILAAGKGTRMKSQKAKVLHEVFYAPMIHHVLQATSSLEARRTIVVIGHQWAAVKESLASFSPTTVIQQEQLGTGHAVLCAKSAIDVYEGNVMILCGDTPLIRPESLTDMLTQHCSNESIITVMTTSLSNPTNYGRIISNTDNTISCIVEEKDTDSEQKKIKEINSGIYCINTKFLFSHLANIGTDNSQGEVYLTDIVTQAVSKNIPVHKYLNPDAAEVLGVNSRLELSQAHSALQIRQNHNLMGAGVTMIQPESIQVSPDSTVAKDVRLHPGVAISGVSNISEGCEIGTGVLLHDVILGEDCTIGAYSCLKHCRISKNSEIPTHSKSC